MSLGGGFLSVFVSDYPDTCLSSEQSIKNSLLFGVKLVHLICAFWHLVTPVTVNLT